jgi:hypothetical protein
MVIGPSSQTIAGDGVEHRGREKAQADGYEQNVEHGNLTFSARSRSSGTLNHIKVPYGKVGAKIRIS